MKIFKHLSFFALIIFWSFSAACFSSKLFKKAELKIEYSKSDITCFGKSNGTIALNISGGKEPYLVEWNNGLDNLNLENLPKGIYTVKVTDAKGLSTLENIVIEMPAPLSVYYNSGEETLIDGFNGVIDATISGGTPWNINDQPNYFVRLNDHANAENPAALEDGVYKLTIEDAGGCMLSVKVNINIEVSKNQYFYEMNTTENDNLVYNGLGNLKLTIFQPNTINMGSQSKLGE